MKRMIPQKKPIIILPVYLMGLLVVLAIDFMIFRGIRKQAGNPIVLSASDVPRITAADAIAAINANEAFLLDTRSAS